MTIKFNRGLKNCLKRRNIKKGMNVLIGGTVLTPALVPAFLNLNNKATACIAGASGAIAPAPSLLSLGVAYVLIFGGSAVTMLLASSCEKE